MHGGGISVDYSFPSDFYNSLSSTILTSQKNSLVILPKQQNVFQTLFNIYDYL